MQGVSASGPMRDHGDRRVLLTSGILAAAALHLDSAAISNDGLAASDETGAHPAARSSRNTARLAAMRSSSSRNPKSVLVVEDDETIRDVIIGALSDAGFGPFGATDLQSARASLEASPPALMILDLSLDRDFGADLLAELASKPDAPCVVVCSAFPLANVVAARYRLELVKKPFDIEVLVAACDRAINEHRRPSMPT